MSRECGGVIADTGASAGLRQFRIDSSAADVVFADPDNGLVQGPLLQA